MALGTALCIAAMPAWAQTAPGAEATQVTPGGTAARRRR